MFFVLQLIGFQLPSSVVEGHMGFRYLIVIIGLKIKKKKKDFAFLITQE